MYDLSWLNPTPHAIAVYASQPLSPAATQQSLPSGRYSLLGPDLHRLDRTSLRLAHLFDHLIGLCQQVRRDSDTDRVCRRQVDYQLELGWLRDRQVGRFLAFENASGIDADLAIAREVACSITHEPADFGEFPQKVDSRKQITGRKCHDLHATIDEERVGTDSQGVRPVSHERSKGLFDLAASLGFVHGNLPPDCCCRR